MHREKTCFLHIFCGLCILTSFSILTITVRGVSNKHCLLLFFTGFVMQQLWFPVFQSALEEVNKLYPVFFKYLIDWKRRKSKHLHHNITNVTSDKQDFYISSGNHELRNDSNVSNSSW